MRKWKIVVVVSVLCLGLFACNKEVATNKDSALVTGQEASDSTEISESSDLESGSDNSNDANDTANSGEEGKGKTKEADKEDKDEIDNKEEIEDKEEIENRVTIKFVTKTNEFRADDDSLLLSGSCTYPVVTIEGNDEVANKINADILEEVKAYEASLPDYIRMAQEDYEYNKSNADYYFYGYTSLIEFSTERNDGNVLSFTELSSDYTGGAHGNYGVVGVNYDLATGERLQLSDLSEDAEMFKSDVLKYVLNLAKSEAYAEMMFSYDEPVLEEMMFGEGKWYFTNSGLNFFANPYEIGPYSSGIIDFLIPYEDLVGLKDSYAYQGNYEKKSVNGMEVVKDINGDGIEEKIRYSVKMTDDYMDYLYELTIDGKDFSDILRIENPDMQAYYLVDLDRTDSFIEIALLDYGPSSDYATHFYRYETDGTLKPLGSISDVWSEKTCYLESNGYIVGNGRLSVLQTWFAPFRWKLEPDGRISRVEEDMYYPDNRFHQEHAILRNVIVYSAMDLKSDRVELTPSDGPVQFTATDDKKWVELKTKDNRVFYVYMSEWMTVMSGDEELEPTTVFGDLVIAD